MGVSPLEDTLKDHRHMGIQEIAVALGVSRQRAYQLLTSDPTFPKPVDHLTGGKVWHEIDVLPWIQARLKGRP